LAVSRDRLEKLSSLFLSVFTTGLALQLASCGFAPRQALGAVLAVAGSIGLALGVRLWPAAAGAAKSSPRA
jgi:hypothetical protein